MGVSHTSDHIQTKIKMANPSPVSSKFKNEDLKDTDVLCTFKIKLENTKIWIIGVSKASDHIQIKIEIPKPSQEPPNS